MNSKEAETAPKPLKFKNSSDPRQRLNVMVYVAKNLPFGGRKRGRKSKSDPVKDRLARRIVATFARAEKKAFTAFGLGPTREIDKEILLALLSWTLFGKTGRKGRPASQQEILEEMLKLNGPRST